jgi:hypothetical protein
MSSTRDFNTLVCFGVLKVAAVRNINLKFVSSVIEAIFKTSKAVVVFIKKILKRLLLEVSNSFWANIF